MSETLFHRCARRRAMPGVRTISIRLKRLDYVSTGTLLENPSFHGLYPSDQFQSDCLLHDLPDKTGF